jgi:hypothetical protein
MKLRIKESMLNNKKEKNKKIFFKTNNNVIDEILELRKCFSAFIDHID